MPEKTTRKCGQCGNQIIISRQNLNNIVFYQSKFYHAGCFEEKATKGLKSKRYCTHWQKILDNLPKYQTEAKRRLEHSMIRDEFNEYLLSNYDVFAVSERFWNIVEDIGNGNYKRKKCKPVDMQTIMDTWKWGQHHLDKIAANNKTNNRGPNNDEQRLNYDLAIVLTHVGDYKKYMSSTKEETARVEEYIEKQNKINYENLYKQSESQKQKEDILDLMDEIF